MVTLSPADIYEACGPHATMKSAAGQARGEGEEGSSASALGRGSGAFTDGQHPVVAGPGEGGLERRETTNAICTGFGRLSRCLILMAFFSGCLVCLHIPSAGS